jgi:hypothetical protein
LLQLLEDLSKRIATLILAVMRKNLNNVVRRDLLCVNVRREKADAAVDIVPHSTRRNHTVRRACGDHTANRKAIALMNVRHCDRVLNDAGQGGGVDQLRHRFVLQRVVQQLFARVQARGRAHIAAKILRHLVHAIANSFEILLGDHTSPHPITYTSTTTTACHPSAVCFITKL